MDDVIAQVLLSDSPAEAPATRDLLLPTEALLPEVTQDATV
jgi:hypothetical protein